MAEGFYFINGLSRFIGQTVTIFTTSGGESGRGFTGVLTSVNCDFVSLTTQIGPGPGCALGNPCDDINGCCEEHISEGFGVAPAGTLGTNTNRGQYYRLNLGSIVEIPIDRIASFVHNSVGSGW
jgi:hypothetical protein